MLKEWIFGKKPSQPQPPTQPWPALYKDVQEELDGDAGYCEEKYSQGPGVVLENAGVEKGA